MSRPSPEPDENRRPDDDPAPFVELNQDGKSPILLVCDHASRALPAAYGTLGLDESLLWRHIAWDIGAADVTRRLSAAIDAQAVLGGVSRLLIDLNRPLGIDQSIPEISDGVAIPGNKLIDEVERRRRERRWYAPYHDAVARRLKGFFDRGVVPALVAVHSFTPVMNGYERPWHVGVLWNEDARVAGPIVARLRDHRNFVVGENQPYTARKPYGYTLHVHGEDMGLAHAAIEVRQDLIDTHHGAEFWSNILADVLGHVVDTLAPFTVEGRNDGAEGT